ncbi:MAG: hypothetical protein ACRCXN_02595 [Bacteroidales bacterium]
MHTHNIPRYRFLILCLLPCLFSLCISCESQELDITESDVKEVQLGVNISVPADQNDIQLKIHNYRLILAEQNSGFIIVNETTLDNSLIISSGLSINVKVKPGKYSAYLIANELSHMTYVFNDAKFINEINTFLVKQDVWQAINELQMPLLAINNIEVRSIGSEFETGEVSDNGGAFLSAYKAQLERIMSKVTLRLNKDSNYDYIIKNVDIIQVAESFSFGKKMVQSNNIITVNTFSGLLQLPQKVNNNYQPVFENFLISEKLFDNITDYSKATIVKIDALINNIPVTYTIPLGKQSGVGYLDYQVLRNHHYLIQGSLAEIGDFVVTVLPWEKESISTEFDPSFSYSFSWKPWMAQIDANQVAISYDSPAECEFVLTKPSGKRWVATLSNGADFQFDHSNNAVSQGISGMYNGRTSLIRVKAKRKLSTGASTTLSIYTEDGRMVPINPANGNVYNIILRAE